MKKLLVLFFAAITTLLGCHKGTAKANEPLHIEMALFFASEPTADPEATLRKLSSQPETRFSLTDVEDKGSPQSIPTVKATWVPITEYAPPDSKAWPHRAVDLPPEVQPKIANSRRVLVIEFTTALRNAVETNRRIGLFLAGLADVTGGFPWDEESRNLFSAAAWRKNRVDSWSAGIPDMGDNIVMDAYRDGEYIRIVTIGMRKFGLPDMVASGVVSHATRTVGHTMNACAQTMVEGGKIENGRLSLDFARIKHPAVRKTMQASPGPGATWKAEVILTPIRPEQGDADNTLLDIDFPVNGSSKQERQQEAMSRLFGSTESLVKIPAGDQELKAASEHARLRLPELRQRFANGLAPRESIAVKAPFRSNDGEVEYMWVEVTGWRGSQLKGTLVNNPMLVKSLKAGSQLSIREDDVFDYIWYRSDGSMQGNETGAILEKIEQK